MAVEQIKCEGCGRVVGEVVKTSADPEIAKFPDGLAHGKRKILQVDLHEQDGVHHIIFEYYTEYGLDGIVIMREIDPEKEMHGPVFHPVRALAAFVDHFKKELEGDTK